jgi:hypothetical protein
MLALTLNYQRQLGNSAVHRNILHVSAFGRERRLRHDRELSRKGVMTGFTL